jgi:hypothetical protein
MPFSRSRLRSICSFGSKLRQHLLRGHLAVADVGQQPLLVAYVERRGDLRERAVLPQHRQIQVVPLEIALQDRPSHGNRSARAAASSNSCGCALWRATS